MSSRPTSGKPKRPEKDSESKEPIKPKNDVKADQESSSCTPNPSSTIRSSGSGSSQQRQSGKGSYYASDDRTSSRGNSGRWDKSRDTRPRGKDDYQGGSRKRDSRELHSGKGDSKGKGHEYRERDGSSGSSTRTEYVSGDLRRQPEGSKAFIDDSRLSKLVRRLVKEEERERKLSAIKQLKEYLLGHENFKTINRSADNLLISFYEILLERTFRDTKDEAVSCIGIVGCVMGSESHRYFEWLFAKLHAASNDDLRIQLLGAIHETVKQDGAKKKLEEFMPIIMDNSRSILENADASDLLVAVMDIILLIAKYHPHVFGNHFRDTVDILVGWHIDSTQKEELTKYTSEALISFHPFWIGDTSFSLTLLGQFLEDLEAYSEDLSLGVSGQHTCDEDMPSPEECLTKIGALLRVFTTVIKSLGEYFHPDRNTSISIEYITDNLERIVACVASVMRLPSHERIYNSSYYEKVYTHANHCVHALIGDLGSYLSSSQETILNYITGQCQQVDLSTNAYIKSLINLTQKVVEMVNTQLPVDFIADIMGMESIFYKLRFAKSTEMLQELMTLYHAIMMLKNVPLLEEGYRHMLGDLEISYNTLLEVTGNDPSFSLVSNNPYKDLKYDGKQAEIAFIFDICALAEISNTKNNIIGMYALSPSIFDLLTQHLLPGNIDVIEQYPAVHYAILQALYSHCTRHGHFVTSSHLITQNTSLEGTVLANLSAQAGGHFSTILSALSDLFRSNSTSHDAKRLGLEWAIEIIDSLTTAQHIYRTREFQELADSVVTLGFCDDPEITLRVCKALQKYMRNTKKHNKQILKRCKELCNIRIASSDSYVREPFFKLIQQIPISTSTRSQNKGVPKSRHKNPRALVHDAEAHWQARRGHMMRLPIVTFHTHNFRSVMAYILEGTPPSKIGSDTWLERLFHSSQRSDKETRRDESAHLAALIDNSDALLWFWATWETAQFCIMSKLRTPLGKPQETLPTIESALKNYSNQVKKKESEDSPVQRESKGDRFMDQIRVTLLLQFMESLEKQLYNAYEGCAVAMVAPPKTVRAFFRTNRSTCEDWLTRVRMCIVSIAAHCGRPALVLRQSYELLTDMVDKRNTNLPEFEQVVMHTVKALCELHSPEALTGLYAWCKEVAGKRLSWIKAAVEFAGGKYEVAVADFRSALNNYINPADASPVNEESKENAGSPPDGGLDDDTGRDSPAAEDDLGFQRFSLLSKHHGGHGNGNSNSPDPLVCNYIVNQVGDCYVGLRSWQDVLDWQETLQGYRSEYNGTALQNAFYTEIDINYVKALSMFEDLDFMAVRETLDLVPGCSITDIASDQGVEPEVIWDRHSVLLSAQKQFIRSVTYCLTSDLKLAVPASERKLELCQKLCRDLLRLGSLDSPPQSHPTVVSQLYSASTLLNQLSTKKAKDLLLPTCDNVTFDPQEHDVANILDALNLLILQDHVQATITPDGELDFAAQIATVRLAAAKLARKQSNVCLAERLLIEEMISCVDWDPEAELPQSIERALSVLGDVQSTSGVKNSAHVIMLEREGAKLQHFKGHHRDGLESLIQSVLRHANVVDLKPVHHRELIKYGGEMNSRSLVTIVQWFQSDHKYLNQISAQIITTGQEEEAPTEVARNLLSLLALEETAVTNGKGITVDEHGVQDVGIGDNPILSESDAVVGRLLHLSTIQSPNLAKAWFALAGWCNKWGRKAVDNAVHGSVELSVDEKAQVLELLPKGTSHDEVDNVLAIMSQIQCGGSSEEDISEQDQAYDDGTETTRKQLLSSCLSLQIASDECVDRLIDVWKGVVKRVYHYYQLSAKAYLTYLKINGQSYEDQTNMDGNITATLRLLRLLVKHAWELRGVLEDGLASTPTAPWKGIIPQLFSRLNHPEPYVRQSVSDLLCRVAHDAPHLIIYPAVVGCSTDKTNVKDTDREGLLNVYLQEKEEEAGEDNGEGANSQEDEPGTGEESNDAMLKNCFSDIVNTLSHTNPQMISEVELFVGELRRITLLWDELWLGTLNQHHADVSRRLTQLENEVKKVVTNPSLSKEEKTAIIAEKHRTILKPTVYTVERLHDITSQPAETSHERWFQQSYNKQIEEALDKLKNPANPSHPQSSWQQFKHIHHSLQQRAQKRSSLLLNMEQISDKLAGLRNTVISMPGLTSDGHVVHIEGIYHTVQILPTKTKPKKLVLLGSDGKKYPYLFKGLEDLHLDERIMQFLSIVNNMFAKANRNDQKLYHARHYSVTPLGARSGLIQWVDGATPLFSLYKRWQQREAIAQQLKPGSTSQITQTNPPTIPRPSEVYYSKLTPALKERGINNLDNRKEWPISATRKALEELVRDTPRDLLSRELWCCSTSPTEWWNVTQMYSRSTAVMSMIGYIIGLGDRHLDNLLVDLATGEIVHIDYNVCFEKGKSLRVPERVPFRMTQNLEAALGLTGIEGTFRLSCEYVIKTMRKGRETLLTLLEAFVYDPLVDWTTGNEGGYTGAFYGGGHSISTAPEGRQSKREMERDITLSMFAIRVAEMKASWFSNREEMLGALAKLRDVVQGHMNSQVDLNNIEQHHHRLQEQMTYIEEAQSDPQHPIYSLGQRYGEYAVVKASRLEVQQAIQEKLTELENWNKLHEYAVQAIQSGQLQRLCGEASQAYSSSLASFACVVDFLQGAGQAQLVTQCEEVSAELNDVILRRRAVLQSCLDLLHTYATVTGHFPASLSRENRNVKWTNWLQELVCEFTTDKCKEVVDNMQELYHRSGGRSGCDVQTVLTTEHRLQSIVTEANGRLIKLIERRSQDTVETALLIVHVEESTVAVHQFMQENDMSGTKCMTSVVVSALCSLSRRYLAMEGAAAGAGERLMDLTSRDGDWFLDELCSMSGNVTHLLGLLNDPSVLQTLSAEVCHQVMQAMNATHSVYMALQDLNMNFHTIILPEAVKALQSQEASVLTSLEALDSIVISAGRPMDDLLSSMELQLRHAIMGMELTDEEAITVVKKMRVKFSDLLMAAPTPGRAGCKPPGSELTPGQMLLMGFNGLFTRLDQDFANMLEAISKLQVPDIWRKVDVVKEASSMQLTAFNDSTLGLLSNLYFLKQLKAMQDFFHLASMTAGTLQGVSGGSCYDDEQLAKPIKLFIAEYVRKHMIGLPSQTLGLVLCLYVNVLGVDVTAEIELRDIGAECKVSLEDLCKKAVELCIQDESFQHVHLSQASTLIGNVDLAWRKSDLARRLDTNIGMVKTRLQCSQLDLARFQWLNEDVLTCSGRNATQMTMPSRATIMAELRNIIPTLMSQESAVTSVQERHTQLEASVSQRLKWAAGANPSLAGVLQQYEEALSAKNATVQSDSNLANEVFNICNGALHMEAMRTNTQEAMAADTAFLALIARCQESCQLIESCTSTVTEVEESIMTSRPLQVGDQVTEDWLNTAIDGIMAELTDLSNKISGVMSNVDTTKEGVKGQVNVIRNVLTTHHQLMSDIRTILKSMARQEEHDFGQDVFEGSIRQYVNTYKTFSENFTTVLKLVMSEELGQEVMNEIDAMLATLTQQISIIYDDLVNYAPPIKTNVKEQTTGQMDFASAAANRAPSTSSESTYPPMSPKKLALARTYLRSAPYPAPQGRRPDKVARDPRTGKAVQERNSYALGVWRRVKMKLDGRDPDVNKRLSVPEQVEYVIREATCIDNLAVLYEGWTPWV